MLSMKDVQAVTRPVIRALIEKKFGTPIACSKFEQPGKENTYSRLDLYSRKKGIYRFIGPKDFIGPEEETLYIGTSGYRAQGLKERVIQNFTGSSGGTLRDKLAEDRFGCNKEEAANWMLKCVSVQLVETPDDEHGELERLAIEVFEPRYKG
ncbi:hypothetical protein F0U61_11955 [Archangium violaceum]|uniref:hypothetical protein n=1 Tax=Archangium violaceum TaxID=83451 RepID=UPI002B296F65|nr:hypothetical protein F0U61_11955 [Archangium violaceum]